MSEGKSDADLGGEGNPNRGTGAEEITERAGGEEQLIAAGDRTSLGSRGGIEANGSDVGGIVHQRHPDARERSRQRHFRLPQSPLVYPDSGGHQRQTNALPRRRARRFLRPRYPGWGS